MAGGSITGVVGSVTWGYYTAAAIHNYTVTRRDASWTLTATVVLSDAFKLSQRPLRFVAPHAHGEWAWPIDTLTIADGALTATLGPPET